MKNFILITNKYKDPDLSVTNRIVSHLEKNHAKCHVLTDLGSNYEEIPKLDSDTECIIVIGGDGTILQAAHVVAGKKIPIIGVNKGTLGFLADVEVSDVEDVLNKVLADDYIIAERMLLKAQIFHDDEMICQDIALNDLVITRSGISRIIECKIRVNGRKMDNYHGDGLIISTPTGSTGYNLSAGGPVVSPKADIILVTPICSHTIGARSTVLVPSDDIWIEVGRLRKTQEEEAIATFDGQTGVELKPGDRIHVAPASEKIYLLKMKENNFYEILHNKLIRGQEV